MNFHRNMMLPVYWPGMARKNSIPVMRLTPKPSIPSGSSCETAVNGIRFPIPNSRRSTTRTTVNSNTQRTE